MPPQIVVLGAGYAGTAAIRSLENELEHPDLVWVSKEPHHFVLHEAHRCIRDPSICDKLTIPIEDIKSDHTRFVRGTVTGIETEARDVIIDGDHTIGYDYLIIAIGSQTAFFGIEGLEAHALTLKSPDDARSIHDQITNAAKDATRDEPAQIVIGGLVSRAFKPRVRSLRGATK
ncbi:NAD(P)/FAD-dependent oxidoreductase [Halocatena marina]|uniref:NADH:ubiquinone reductase (non-electrogenic) n=1 Tax=Halocatena marina TaxID=2934937 RepID=A0ABD5YMF4_9EURY